MSARTLFGGHQHRAGHMVGMSTSSTRHAARCFRHSLVEAAILVALALALVILTTAGPVIPAAHHGARAVADPSSASSQADQLWQTVTGPSPVVIPGPEHTGFPWVPRLDATARR